MDVTIDGERVTRLTELRRNATVIIDQLQAARTPQESRMVITLHGEPVAVLQEYKAYQQLLEWVESIQHKLQVAEVRERLRQLNAGIMKTVPLDQVIGRLPSAQGD